MKNRRSLMVAGAAMLSTLAMFVANASAPAVGLAPFGLYTATGGTHPIASVINSNNGKIYTAHASSWTVGVTDRDGFARTVRVDRGPSGIAINETTNKIYVSHYGHGGPEGATVKVINGFSDAVEATIPLTSCAPACGSIGIDVNPVTNKIFVVNYWTHTVSVLDGATNTEVASIPVGGAPIDVAVNKVTNKAYVSNNGNATLPSSISVIDGGTNAVVTTINDSSDPSPAGDPYRLRSPWGVAVDHTTNTVYVTNQAIGRVSVINGATDAITGFISTGAILGGPLGLSVDIANKRLWVAIYTTNSVNGINLETGRSFGTFRLGPNTAGAWDTVVNQSTGDAFGITTGPTSPLSQSFYGNTQRCANDIATQSPDGAALCLVVASDAVTIGLSQSYRALDPGGLYKALFQ